MRFPALLLAALLCLPRAAPAGEQVSAFTMLNGTVGVIVTGLEEVPPLTAGAIVAGFVEALGSDGGGADLLNAGRVIVVRGLTATVGGAAPGLVVDWRVSVEGGGDIGQLYSVVEDVADWSRLAPAEAAALGREAGTRFLDAHFTAAVIRATGSSAEGGAILVE